MLRSLRRMAGLDGNPNEVQVYVNGEAREWPTGARGSLIDLANSRSLSALRSASLSVAALQFLHDGYSHGFLHVA